MDTLPGTAVDGILAAFETATLQAVGLADIVEAPVLVRAGGAFLAVLVVGGALVWRFEPLVDRSIDSSTSKPLWSVAYGVAAHLVFGFVGFYLAVKLQQITVSGTNAGPLGLVVMMALLVGAAALGFTVVGSTIIGLRGERNLRGGLVVGSVLAGAAMVATPTITAVAWVAIVSFGIGGPVRKWLQASAGPDL